MEKSQDELDHFKLKNLFVSYLTTRTHSRNIFFNLFYKLQTALKRLNFHSQRLSSFSTSSNQNDDFQLSFLLFKLGCRLLCAPSI